MNKLTNTTLCALLLTGMSSCSQPSDQAATPANDTHVQAPSEESALDDSASATKPTANSQVIPTAKTPVTRPEQPHPRAKPKAAKSPPPPVDMPQHDMMNMSGHDMANMSH